MYVLVLKLVMFNTPTYLGQLRLAVSCLPVAWIDRILLTALLEVCVHSVPLSTQRGNLLRHATLHAIGRFREINLVWTKTHTQTLTPDSFNYIRIKITPLLSRNERSGNFLLENISNNARTNFFACLFSASTALTSCGLTSSISIFYTPTHMVYQAIHLKISWNIVWVTLHAIIFTCILYVKWTKSICSMEADFWSSLSVPDTGNISSHVVITHLSLSACHRILIW